MDVVTIFARWSDFLAVESVLSAIVFVVVAGLVWLMRNRGPALHVGLWSLVFIRLILPPDLAHPLGSGTLMDSFKDFASPERCSFV